MKALTKKQIVFLLGYPFVHCVLGVVAVLMALQAGFDQIEQPATQWETLIAAFGTGLFHILIAPILLLKWMGLTLPSEGYIDYFWLYLTGVLYSFAIVYYHKWRTGR